MGKEQMRFYDAKVIFETDVSAYGNSYLIIYGKHVNGYFCCIPNWKIGCEMAEPSDTFWNFERLLGAGLNEKTAKALSLRIKEIAESIA